MVQRFCRFSVLFLIICATLCNFGCRTSGDRDGNGYGDEVLAPEELSGNVALDGRFELGTLVTEVSFDNVYFAYDSYQIPRSEIDKIERVADYMKSHKDVRLIVEGHCDERGSREYNMSLGEHRALAVRAYLVGLGIGSARIQTCSYGEEQPLDFGHTEAAWRRNRRAEFVLYR